jgi:hypothetical protein
VLLHFISSLRPRFEGDSGGGSGAGGNQGGDPAEGFKRLLEKNGSDALRVAELLHRENYTEREQNRALKEQLAAAQGKVPAEGAIVLTPEQAQAWQAYSGLGDIASIQAAIAERDTTKGELATIKRDLELRDVASIANYKPAVLRQLAGDAQFVIKEADGKRSVSVKDGDKETPIADYAKTKWADFLPALQVEQARPAIGTPQTRSGGTPPPAAQANTPKRSIL